MNRQPSRSVLIALLILLGGCQPNISGSYLSSDDSSVVELRLVRTSDGRLTGDLAISELKSDGRIERKSLALSGAADRENVTLSGSQFMGLSTVTFSGTLRGSILTLSSGAQPVPLVFKRSTLSEYQARQNFLNARAQSLLAAKATSLARLETDKAERAFVARVDQLVANIHHFDSEADLHLGRFPAIEPGYRAITAKISGYVDRERDLAGKSNASVARSQLCVAATQASLETDQLHNQGQVLASSLVTNVKPMLDEAATLDASCHTMATRETLIESQAQACSRLGNALPAFRQKYDAITGGLNHLELVYVQEKNKQQALLKESEDFK